MKKILLLSSLILIIVFVKAQDPLFVEGDKLLNIGIGLQSYPIVSASLDYCIADDIIDVGSFGIGAYAGIGFGVRKYFRDHVYMGAGVRGTFHYPIIDDLDTYIGLGAGIRITTYNKYNSTHFIPGFFLGANYPISDRIKVFGEVGSGMSYITAGLTIFI